MTHDQAEGTVTVTLTLDEIRYLGALLDAEDTGDLERIYSEVGQGLYDAVRGTLEDAHERASAVQSRAGDAAQ